MLWLLWFIASCLIETFSHADGSCALPLMRDGGTITLGPSHVECFSHTSQHQAQYYRQWPSTYEHCWVRDFCIVGKTSSPIQLLFVGSPKPGVPQQLHTCPNNYPKRSWCSAQTNWVNCAALTDIVGGAPVTVIHRPTYLTGRWKHGNIVESTFEGTFALQFAQWRRYFPVLRLANLSLFFFDTFSLPPDTDWGRDLFYNRSLLVVRRKAEAYCFRDALVGTPMPYFDVPAPFSQQLLFAMVASAYQRSGLQPVTANGLRWSSDGIVTNADPPTSVTWASPRPRPRQPLRVLLYIKSASAGNRMGGRIANPSAILEIFQEMSYTYQGRELNVSILRSWDGLRPADQVRLMSRIDLYISDGGTAGFIGLFLRPGSSAIRTAKCVRACRCPEESHTVSYWYGLNATGVLYLWYNQSASIRCAVASHYPDIVVEPRSFLPLLHSALEHTIKYHGLNAP